MCEDILVSGVKLNLEEFKTKDLPREMTAEP